MQLDICTKLHGLTQDFDESMVCFLWTSIASILLKFNELLPELIEIVSIN